MNDNNTSGNAWGIRDKEIEQQLEENQRDMKLLVQELFDSIIDYSLRVLPHSLRHLFWYLQQLVTSKWPNSTTVRTFVVRYNL